MTWRVAGLCVLWAMAGWRAEGRWAVESPYRAVVRGTSQPAAPECGVLIELPEFGQTMPAAEDVTLFDSAGRAVPVAMLWRGAGQRVLLLARELREGEEYHVYCGGTVARKARSWSPLVSLMVETRRLGDSATCNSWSEMESAWKNARVSDGAGFVDAIDLGANPFGENSRFMTRFRGYLRTEQMKEVFLYTLSSDGSFVLVDGVPVVEWPGKHSPLATQDTIRGKSVLAPGGRLRVDYYQMKNGDGPPAAVLGWRRSGRLQPVPAEAWLHAGRSELLRMESTSRVTPCPEYRLESYIGYGGLFYYETSFSLLGGLREGWTARWQFADGAELKGATVRRVMLGDAPQTVMVEVRGPGGETERGTRRVDFIGDVRAASITSPADVERYTTLLVTLTPQSLAVDTSRAAFRFVQEFGDDAQAGRTAEALLRINPTEPDPAAQSARLRAMVQVEPRQALLELQRMNMVGRQKDTRALAIIELDLLTFYLRDPAIVQRAMQLGVQFPNTDLAKLAKVRVGDHHRLQGRHREAIEQYRSVQPTDALSLRKLPAQDRAYSITIHELLKGGHRLEAEQKLHEWEIKHPMAKLDTDFLVLRARMLMEFGRWREALVELESFEKLQPESPHKIDAAFRRARALFALGQKDEARAIWNEIARNFPKHELAGPSQTWASR